MNIGKEKDIPDLVGFLEKKGSLGLIHLWRKRWFVKRNNMVFYYSEKMPNRIFTVMSLTRLILQNFIKT